MSALFGSLQNFFSSFFISQSSPADWENINSHPTPSYSAKVADEIITKAEIKALEIGVEKNLEERLFDEELNKKLDAKIEEAVSTLKPSLLEFTQNISRLEKLMADTLEASQKKNEEFLVQMQKQSVSMQASIDGEARNRVNELMLEFEQKLTDFFSSAEEKSMEAISLEIKSARQLIDSYKNQQISIIDENIVSVLERTLSLVLNKKLSLEDQLDLVYKSLEKAKLEKFLV